MQSVEIWELNIRIKNEIAKFMNAEYLLFLQPTMRLEGVQSIMPNNPNSSDAKMLKVILDDVGE